jgi:acetolactate synthase-1/3 small subunit
MNTIIRILVNNRPGVLDRIAGIVRRRGWNIDGLTVGTMEGNLVQISLSINGQHIDVTEFGDRLSELHDVEDWEECRPQNHIAREILLFSYGKNSDQTQVVSRLGEVRTIEEMDGVVHAECTGSPGEITAAYELLKQYSIPCVRIGNLIMAKEGGDDKDGKRDVPDSCN